MDYLADIIALILLVAFAIIGLCVGFSGGIRFFTRGIFGIIICVIATYFVFGLVASIGFVDDWLGKWWTYVVLAVGLFIIMMLLRWALVKIFSMILEAPNVVCKVINKIFGMIFWVAVLFVLILLVMQIYYWISGAESIGFLDGSFLKLDWLYEHNPLTTFIKGSGGGEETEGMIEEVIGMVGMLA
ncbi:MAG: hypothetical protein LUD29_06420 [Clostridia bacterium]|nr:hypothetical protein [Clostridia bacterium]